MLSYYLESIIIGIYTFLVYLGLFWIENLYVRFFLLGFWKHSLSYFYLHDYFCESRSTTNTPQKYDHSYLVIESMLEGFYFMVLGSFIFTLLNIRKKQILLPFFIVFFMGMVTHILAEWFGIHQYFYETRCGNLAIPGTSPSLRGLPS